MVDFGSGPVDGGSSSAFLVKLDASGNYLWSKTSGNASQAWQASVAADSLGNAFLALNYSGSVNLGMGAFTSAGSNDILLAKLDSSGNVLWNETFGDLSNQEVRGIAADNAGNVFIVGFFSGILDFGAPTLPLTSSGQDVFVAKFASDGSPLWSKNLGLGVGYGIATGGSGIEYVVVTGAIGDISGQDFGCGPITPTDIRDVFVAKFDTNGNCAWSAAFPGPSSSSQYGQGVAVDGAGNVALVGSFANDIEFGLGKLNSAGSDDIFVAKFLP
jgi:hypothetical protein